VNTKEGACFILIPLGTVSLCRGPLLTTKTNFSGGGYSTLLYATLCALDSQSLVDL
jgi:hypothetical protein